MKFFVLINHKLLKCQHTKTNLIQKVTFIYAKLKADRPIILQDSHQLYYIFIAWLIKKTKKTNIITNWFLGFVSWFWILETENLDSSVNCFFFSPPLLTGPPNPVEKSPLQAVPESYIAWYENEPTVCLRSIFSMQWEQAWSWESQTGQRGQKVFKGRPVVFCLSFGVCWW